MDVAQIVKAHLEEKGYDGLCNPGLGCACLTENLFNCYDWGLRCQAGYLGYCEGTDRHDIHLYTSKKKAAKAAKKREADA